MTVFFKILIIRRGGKKQMSTQIETPRNCLKKTRRAFVDTGNWS